MLRSLGNKDILLQCIPAGSFWPLQRLPELSLLLPVGVGLQGEGPNASLGHAEEVSPS